jgi:sporulation protein YlmC with PRC-barrel domain
MPPFEEERLVDAHVDPEKTDSTENQVPLVIGTPMMGVPIPQIPGSHLPATRIEQNIPDGTVAVMEGATVITAEGKHVGNVESILADPSAEEVTHLLISKGLLLKEMKLIPMKWVRSLGEEKVQLRVKQERVDKLADVSPSG